MQNFIIMNIQKIIKMMTKDDYQHFVCVVAGDNPETLIKEYNAQKEVPPYILYKYKDAESLRKKYINQYEQLLSIKKNDDFEREYIQNVLADLKEIDIDEFFEELCDDDCYFDDNGNIITKRNPDGKFSHCNIGKVFSIPFLTKDGREIFQAKKSEIDWEKIHLAGGEVYARVWEMVMEDSTPENEHEKVLFDNMKDKTVYLEKFENKENYIASNTAFWGYAFLSELTGWIDAGTTKDQFGWMSNFYDVFIKNLPEDTTLTIYECKK